MANQKIEFRKIREFGENLTDTFIFIRHNFKALILSVLAICGPVMLITAILNGVYQSHAFGIFDEIRKGLTSGYGSRAIWEIFTPIYLLIIIFSWVLHISLQVVLAAYIKIYVEQEGVAPRIEQIWNVFIDHFFTVFIYSIPIVMLTIVGMICCLAPGIWLLVVMMPFTMILVIEDADFGEAFNRCFAIIRDNFWITLAIYLVSGMIYSFCSTMVGVMVGVVVGLITFFSTDNISTTAGLVTSFLNVFSGFFYIIFFVSAGFQYYTLVERKDGTGLMRRVDTIGTDQKSNDHIEEQY